jgi:hypothetical protein
VFRKYVLALTLLALPLATLVGTTAASASQAHTTTVTFTGKIDCKIASTSTITSKPGLKLTTPAKVTFTLSATTTKCSGHTTQSGDKIISGKVSASITGKYDCLSLLGTLPTLKGSIIWKTSGKAATKTSLTLSAGKVDSKTDIVTYHSRQKGSFAGARTVAAKIKQTETQLEKACETKAGLTKINLSSGSFT